MMNAELEMLKNSSFIIHNFPPHFLTTSQLLFITHEI